MITLQNLKEIIEHNTPEVALTKIEPLIEDLNMGMNKDSRGESLLAALLAEKGKLLWKLGNRGGAISAYEASAQQDPDGPGAMLLEHSRKIMDFFDPNQLNP